MGSRPPASRRPFLSWSRLRSRTNPKPFPRGGSTSIRSKAGERSTKLLHFVALCLFLFFLRLLCFLSLLLLLLRLRSSSVLPGSGCVLSKDRHRQRERQRKGEQQCQQLLHERIRLLLS